MFETVRPEHPETTRSVKRRKTTRACDYCRAHRIRCEYLSPDGVCKHCRDYGFVCEQVAPAPKDDRPRKAGTGRSESAEDVDSSQGLEPGYLGPSSLSCLITEHLGAKGEPALADIDAKHDQYRVTIGDRGEQVLLLGRDVGGETPDDEYYGTQRTGTPRRQSQLALSVGAESLMDDLLKTCRKRIIPLFPVVSISESFINLVWDVESSDLFGPITYESTPPTPLPRIIKLVLCAIPALSRRVPASIRSSVLASLHHRLESPECAALLNTSSLSSIQLLLMLSLSTELQARDAYQAQSLRWLRTGTAIRMAFEIALHRDLTSRMIPVGQLRRRQRVWGGCLIVDRWMSIGYGQPLSIQVEDCDAPLPNWFPDHMRPNAISPTPCFRFHHALTQLSLLMGRVYRLTSSPSGLRRAEDSSLYVLQNDLDVWHQNLPAKWPYYGPFDVPEADEVLNLLSTCVEFSFIKAFMWSQTPIQTTITYRPSASRIDSLTKRAARGIQWAAGNGEFYFDTWYKLNYALMCCAFLQFRAYESRGLTEALRSLDTAVDIFRLWANARVDDVSGERSHREKLAQYVMMLRVAATGDGPLHGDLREVPLPSPL